MGAIAKAYIPEVLRPSTDSALIRAVFLDSSTHIRMVDLQEIGQLSRVAPVIVLVPTSFAGERKVPGQIAAASAIQSARSKTEALQLADKPVDQPKASNSESESVFGDVTVNFPEMMAYRKGKPIVLTNLEFKTLKYLIQNPRHVISRDKILNEVWGYENYPCTRTVDNHILRLRIKLEKDPSRPAHFLTVHGAGYKFLP